MLKQSFLLAAVSFSLVAAAGADTVQLKDKATVVGTILAEKRDQVVVDIGYTVLTIPRNQIVKLSHGSSSKAVVESSKPVAPSQIAEAHAGLYAANSKAMPIRAVRDLVNQLGEAVVQVRTPSGLGSG